MLEELHGYDSTLAVDGSISRDISFNHLIQLLGAHFREELQRLANCRLIDGETHEGSSRVVSGHVRHFEVILVSNVGRAKTIHFEYIGDLTASGKLGFTGKRQRSSA